MADHSQMLLNAIENVFLPPKVPQKAPDEKIERQFNGYLANAVDEAIQKYEELLPTQQPSQWTHIHEMISHVATTALTPLYEIQLAQDLGGMSVGGKFPTRYC